MENAQAMSNPILNLYNQGVITTSSIINTFSGLTSQIEQESTMTVNTEIDLK